ncbi:hypothetical protein PR003_g50 [Phytophthora rubi]|uniref:Uncharacterized protein n=1 Tax=Phytophthora rubi TaxID=129364 RepID=A0A6A4G9T6_9STRA|nr:hypothetical protein PR003_g50 [Phytophthora rubi]
MSDLGCLSSSLGWVAGAVQIAPQLQGFVGALEQKGPAERPHPTIPTAAPLVMQ